MINFMYIHPFSKTLQFQSISDVYIYIFYFLIRKVLKTRHIYIHQIYFEIATFLKTGVYHLYIYIYIYHLIQ